MVKLKSCSKLFTTPNGKHEKLCCPINCVHLPVQQIESPFQKPKREVTVIKIHDIDYQIFWRNPLKMLHHSLGDVMSSSIFQSKKITY